MKSKVKRSGSIPHERLVSILPAIIIGIIILFTTIATALVNFPPATPLHQTWLVVCGLFGILHLVFYYFAYNVTQEKILYAWGNTLLAGIVFCALSYFLPREIKPLIYVLVFISALPASLLVRRGPSHILLFTVTTFHFLLNLGGQPKPHELIIHIGFTIAAFIGIETVQQLKNIDSKHIKRLEIINELSKHIVSTLETKQVFALLDAAVQNALEADSYYVGILDGDELLVELLYDDGEYFRDIRIDKKGSLANWVLTHQQGLFLPDLRKDIELDDVEIITVGKDKPSLSWMGVPMCGTHVEGIIAISSYQPNAFDRSDMELLENIAQRAALALDNTYHHDLVKKQAQLDSLTEVYNHGSFIKTLRQQAEDCQEQNQPLSLIMLDVDHFKQYNDTYGHLIGDEVLIGLCNVIRSHIKSGDAVGRWGGEEFAISLPNTSEQQALRVAERIRESMAGLKVRNAEEATIPIPTVSQGIAIFPEETDNIIKLIDLADERLYNAKKRGRDQVESASTLMEEIGMGL